MQLEDFAYFIFVPVLLLPLAAVYITLRVLRWDAKSKLFLDSWIVWLTWVVSTILSYFMMGWTDSKFYWSRGFAGYWFTVIFLGAGLFANITTIALALEVLRRKRNTESAVRLFDETDSAERAGPKTFTVSVFTTFAACMSLVVGFAAITALDKAYIHYYPPAPDPVGFHIYD
jgi:hypothetical protein